jgi:DNA-binding CsgD family transcriptional regulator
MEYGDARYYQQGPLREGWEALERGTWDTARAQFEAALGAEETPAGWEGLATAAWCQNDLATSFTARERAYTLYREQGDLRSAARVAIWLAWDYLGRRMEVAVANGWLQRAHSLLDDQPPGREHGWLAAREAENAVLWGNDPVAGRELAGQAAAIGQATDLIDLEMLSRAIEGFALVSAGVVGEGMSLLDEATVAATGGEMTNRIAIGSTCCYLIFACERVHDYDRAAQWCRRLKDYCLKIGYVPLLAVCRSHYAGVLIWSGAWSEAESELDLARRSLQTGALSYLAEATVRLGILRWHQGRLDEAVPMLEQVSYFPPAQLALGGIALDLGDAETALDYADRYLRHIPPANRTEQVGGLELRIHAHLALGQVGAAAEALAPLAALTEVVGTDPLRATTAALAGRLAAAQGDRETARSRLEDAVDLYARCGAPFEEGRARLALAGVLRTLGRAPAAEREARTALTAFRTLGAAREVARATALANQLAAPPGPAPALATPAALLSIRQTEVLRLVAEGLSDQEIAAQLLLSPHTVHRHIANILARLDVASRAAAVASAARQGLL